MKNTRSACSMRKPALEHAEHPIGTRERGIDQGSKARVLTSVRSHGGGDKPLRLTPHPAVATAPFLGSRSALLHANVRTSAIG